MRVGRFLLSTLAILAVSGMLAALGWAGHVRGSDNTPVAVGLAAPEATGSTAGGPGSQNARAGLGGLAAAGTYASPRPYASDPDLLTPLDPTLAPLPTTAGIGRVIGGRLTASAVTGTSAILVVDAATGHEIYARSSERPMMPASVTKLLTAVAALKTLGPDHRFVTQVVTGPRPGQIVLVGGGDPLLTTATTSKGYPGGASLAALARSTAAALGAQGLSRVTLSYDASLFSGPRLAVGWRTSYFQPGDSAVAPVSALSADHGRKPGSQMHYSDPANGAAHLFAALLAKNGIKVNTTITTQRPAAGADALAAVQSPPLAGMVEEMLSLSDNDVAEALGRQVAIATRHAGTFAGAAQAVTDVNDGLGVNIEGVTLHDASGLSREDRIPPTALVSALERAMDPRQIDLGAVISGLPIAGFSGTLANRNRTAQGFDSAGGVRAKTGTLTGVASLAGIVYDRDGRLLVMAVIANDITDAVKARNALDNVAAQLAACGCR